MEIRDGKIIVYPSVKLIAKLYADGMSIENMQELFGFKKQRDCYLLLKRYLPIHELTKLKIKRQNKKYETFNSSNNLINDSE